MTIVNNDSSDEQTSDDDEYWCVKRRQQWRVSLMTMMIWKNKQANVVKNDEAWIDNDNV